MLCLFIDLEFIVNSSLNRPKSLLSSSITLLLNRRDIFVLSVFKHTILHKQQLQIFGLLIAWLVV
jgi:hypothetical protein